MTYLTFIWIFHCIFLDRKIKGSEMSFFHIKEYFIYLFIVYFANIHTVKTLLEESSFICIF